MLICRLQVLLEEDHKLNCNMNLAWNSLNLRDGWENCMFFKIKTLKIPKYLYFLMPSDCAFLSTKGFAR